MFITVYTVHCTQPIVIFHLTISFTFNLSFYFVESINFTFSLFPPAHAFSFSVSVHFVKRTPDEQWYQIFWITFFFINLHTSFESCDDTICNYDTYGRAELDDHSIDQKCQLSRFLILIHTDSFYFTAFEKAPESCLKKITRFFTL